MVIPGGDDVPEVSLRVPIEQLERRAAPIHGDDEAAVAQGVEVQAGRDHWALSNELAEAEHEARDGNPESLARLQEVRNRAREVAEAKLRHMALSDELAEAEKKAREEGSQESLQRADDVRRRIAEQRGAA